MASGLKLYEVHSLLLPRLIYVNALPC